MKKIRIEASTGYDVLIGPGLLKDAGKLIAECTNARSVAVITDDRVMGIYGDALMKSLADAGFSAVIYAFQNGERSKNMKTLSDILEFLGENQIGRSDLVVCLGGGVVGDIGGLAAALNHRGTAFVQIPTTLLAAVDSSVGGKTAVDLSAGKNLAGIFAQPIRVICDTDILRHLPEALLADGAAEVAKYGVLEAPELLDCLLKGHLIQAMEAVVHRSVSIKRDYVCGDEFDQGKRQMLNLGHTIGHGIEKCSNYEVTHGQGVAMGLYAIARAAFVLGKSPDDTSIKIKQTLRACGLKTDCAYHGREVFVAMMRDKKRRGDEITLVIPEKIGQCTLLNVPVDSLHEWLEAGGIPCG